MSKHTENPFSNDFDLSNKQKHDIEKVVNNLCEAANDIGISRYDAKQEAYAKGLTSSHDINATMGVTSYNSMKDFKHFGLRVRKDYDKNYWSLWYNLTTIRLDIGETKQLLAEKSEFYDVGLGTKCNAKCPFCYV